MKPILIIVAGGSASGKTTVVSQMLEKLNPNDVGIICEDNYYNDQSSLTMEERMLTNYDHPNSFDTKLLYTQLKSLLNGSSIKEPVYDFKIHNRKENEYILVEPKKVIILEGILALYDKKIRDLDDVKHDVALDVLLSKIKEILRGEK